MDIFQRVGAQRFLRIGIGLMYLYSGFDLMLKPYHWYAFLPQWFSSFLRPLLAQETYLRMQGAAEIIIGIIFLAWFMPRYLVRAVAFLSAMEMALILIFVGVDPITFRDLGLLGASLAILSLK